MGFPILVRAVLARIPKVVLQTPMARAIHRKGGARVAVAEAGAAGTLPIPILSLEGSKRGCSTELQNLIYAFRSDGQAAEDALMDYIEAQLGESIQEAYPGEWDAAAGGDPQTITIDLGSDVLTLTLAQCFDESGTEYSCANLATATVPMGQYDFPITTRTEGTPPPPPGSPSAIVTRTSFTQYPDGAFHIADDPEMVWLNSTTDTPIRDRMFGGGTGGVVVGGITYTPAIRVNWSYTVKVGIRETKTYSNANLINTTHIYTHYPPLLGFNLVSRFASGDGTPDIDDPLTSVDYNQSTSRASVSAGFEPWAPWHNPARTSGSTVVSLIFSGSSWAGSGGIVSDAANWNANRTIYDPAVSLNDTTLEITVSALNRENALYIAYPGCVPSPPAARNSYHKITVDYGGYFNNRSIATTSAALYGDDNNDEVDGFIKGVYDRAIAGDTTCGLAESAYRRVLPEVISGPTPAACPDDARCITAGPP